ncbi:hypothetical protein LLEC1_05477 [Akanthomyces lecanii]|uniref:Cytochrome P450 n=1 Tax=Cordyceps confragosa TaxID=2714763 RepID=A0A179IHH8_CORDF|nr:hypothetical protein LLEC1_05477 [Akanthomyces lecanii]
MEAVRKVIWSSIAGCIASRGFAALCVLALSAVALALISLVLQRPKLPQNAPKYVAGWPVLGSIEFYLGRRDFLERDKKKNGGHSFSFHYGKYPIVSLAGETGRTLLYTSRQFDLRAGYSTLLAASPSIETDIDNPAASQLNLFKKILTRDRLVESLPSILEDTDAALRGLSSTEGTVSIFPLMYRLIYRLTHRTAGVHEIAEDETMLDSTLNRFSGIEHCSALQIMFPAWPLPSMLSKLWAGFNLHRVIVGAMNERRRTGRSEKDALQFLMDLGETDLEIVKIDALISSHRRTAEESVLDILQRVPYHDWDVQLPAVHVCLRETLRLNLSGPALRKNLSNEDIAVPGTGQLVPKKAFVFYAMEDVHLDENIYPNAQKWEPDRHLPGRDEGANKPHAFVGWGSGLHPCFWWSGMARPENDLCRVSTEMT